MEQMKNYLENADEMMKDIVHQAETASVVALHNASEMVHNASEIVHSGVHNASEMVMHNASEMVHNASEMVHSGVHNASEMVHRSTSAVKSGVHHAEELAKDVVERIRHWNVIQFEKLPKWLKDNEHLHFGHRPELRSFAECFKSIFRIHTETGNIWTHLIGFVAFVIATVIFYVRPLCATCQLDINLSEKLIFLTFFIGAIMCLAFSTIFHTVSCHSKLVNEVFARLDYAGIAFLIVGSVIPWLYYGFYCHFYLKLSYITLVSMFGILTIILAMWNKFNKPEYRVHRAVTFVALALMSCLPIVHYFIEKGFYNSLLENSMQYTIIMGALYLTGTLLYAARIPERFMPGKCDIWFQSHQIFHVLVIAGAFVHYHGISEMAVDRLKSQVTCLEQFTPELNENQILTGAIY